MACECEIYACLTVAPTLDTCPDTFIVDLLSTETGNWIMQHEFNGRWFNMGIEVVEGSPLSLPNVFNEHYKHTIKFYDANGISINDTCYTLDTSKIGTLAVPRETQPTNTSMVYEYIVVDNPDGFDSEGRLEIESGSTITDNRLIGKIITSIVVMGGQSYNSGDYSKPKLSNTLTMNSTGFGATTVITLYYS